MKIFEDYLPRRDLIISLAHKMWAKIPENPMSKSHRSLIRAFAIVALPLILLTGLPKRIALPPPYPL